MRAIVLRCVSFNAVMDGMQPTRTAARGPYLTVNRERLDELRKAHGIDSDADLARVIGVDPTTLYRVREGKTVASNEFLAKVAVAFPGASFDRLFTVVHETPKLAVA